MKQLETNIKKAIYTTSLIFDKMPAHRTESINGIRDELHGALEYIKIDSSSIYDAIDAVVNYLEDLDIEIQTISNEDAEDLTEELKDLVDIIKSQVLEEY